MFLQFYGMREQPFGVTPDPRFIHFSRTHREALSTLFCGIQDHRGFLALIAPPGTGKTTLLFYLLERLQASARTVFLFDTPSDPEDLMLYLASDLGLNTAGLRSFNMRQQFDALLSKERLAGKNVVIVVDEAQNLSHPVLEKLRMLSNFECGTHKLLQIVLAGQPSLATRLARPDLLQLRQRLSTVTGIAPLAEGEVCAYVQHRLTVAGCGGELFTRNALALVAAESGGTPRTINILCYNALALGCAQKRKRIDSDIIEEAAKDLALETIKRGVLTDPGGVRACFRADGNASMDPKSPPCDETGKQAIVNIARAKKRHRGLSALANVSRGIAMLLIIIIPLGFRSPARTRLESKSEVPLASPALQTTAVPKPTAAPVSAGRWPASVTVQASAPVVTNIRYWSQSISTLVAIEIHNQVKYEVHRLTSPDRIYVDFYGSRLKSPLLGKRLQVSDAIVKKIRFAQHSGPVTRVTIETYGVCEFKVVAGTKLDSLMIEVQQQARVVQHRPDGAIDASD